MSPVVAVITQLYVVAGLALATAAISTTISKSLMFEWLRAVIYLRSDFWGDGISCPYCVSHWISLPLVYAYAPQMVEPVFGPVDFAVNWFAVIGASALILKALSVKA